jgi:4-diphosphocytidyl-2-C-methyl-D-erythritol kinase
MILFPNAKINLGLRVIRKRPDGYHDLETVFLPIYGLRDALEIIPQHQQDPANPVHMQSSGLAVPGDPNDNLCVKAWQLLKQDFPDLPAIDMHLHKAIPMGAGLGGGSADGAFALQLLNTSCRLQLSTDQLMQYALQLGSDCPFFIHNKPCLAYGRGEILQPLSLDLSDYQIVLINPGIHVATGWAFGQLTPQQPTTPLQEIIALPVEQWRDQLINDFEAPVMQQYPTIARLLKELYAAGAVFAAMTGTGSTVFGLFPKTQTVDLKTGDGYWVGRFGL